MVINHRIANSFHSRGRSSCLADGDDSKIENCKIHKTKLYFPLIIFIWFSIVPQRQSFQFRDNLWLLRMPFVLRAIRMRLRKEKTNSIVIRLISFPQCSHTESRKDVLIHLNRTFESSRPTVERMRSTAYSLSFNGILIHRNEINGEIRIYL